ncbi:hypothetical protein P7K49_027191, partial [Saguinus oedipus]
MAPLSHRQELTLNHRSSSVVEAMLIMDASSSTGRGHSLEAMPTPWRQLCDLRGSQYQNSIAFIAHIIVP